jgi:hypothetical protein
MEGHIYVVENFNPTINSSHHGEVEVKEAQSECYYLLYEYYTKGGGRLCTCRKYMVTIESLGCLQQAIKQ